MPSETSFEVLLFGALKDAALADRITVRGTQTLSVAQLLQALAIQHSSLQDYLPYVRVAVNCEYTGGEQEIQSGDEIALIPPVAGGSSNSEFPSSFLPEKIYFKKIPKKC